MLKLHYVLLSGLACVSLSVRAEEPAKDVPAPLAKQEETFTGPAAGLKTMLEDLFTESKKVNSTNAAEKAKARTRIESSLDWDRVAQACIGPANAKKNAARMGEFKKLLKDVVITTAFTRLDKFWEGGTSYKWDKIDVKGNDAHVVAKFLVNGEPFLLDYWLQQKGSRWEIYDLAFEGMRYSVNINEQLDAFLKEKSFPQLLEKLRKKKEDLVSDKKKS